LLQLLFGPGAGFGFEILVDGDEQSGAAGVDAGVLVIECGDEELGGGKGDVDRAISCGVGDVNVFRPEEGEVDAGDGLAVDDQEDTISSEKIGEDGTGFVAFYDGVERVDDGLQAVEPLNLLDHRRDGGVEAGGPTRDESCSPGEQATGGMTDEDTHGSGTKDESKQEGDEGSGGGAAAGGVLNGHLGISLAERVR